MAQHVVKERRVDRLGHVIVHAGIVAFLLVFLERTGAHGDNRNLLEELVVFFADGLGRGQAVHHRHLQVHQHEVEGILLQQIQGFLAVVCDHRGQAHAVEQRDGQFLVHLVVFDEQNLRRLEVNLPLFLLDGLLVRERLAHRLLEGAQQRADL